MHFTNGSVRQAVCVNEKFPSLQIVWMELEYKVDVYRAISNPHNEHY
jgi:hypothetical protein